MRRRVAPDSSVTDDGEAERQDIQHLSSAICNSEDLGPFIHKAFTSGRSESLLHSLHHFAHSKESEIEEVCKAHYQDFIRAVTAEIAASNPSVGEWMKIESLNTLFPFFSSIGAPEYLK